jgi:hypothetical protein
MDALISLSTAAAESSGRKSACGRGKETTPARSSEIRRRASPLLDLDDGDDAQLLPVAGEDLFAGFDQDGVVGFAASAPSTSNKRYRYIPTSIRGRTVDGELYPAGPSPERSRSLP